jgi:hypothetical protein
VIDWKTDEDFTFPVDGPSAVEAFHHPFAYAPTPSTPAGV